MALKITQIDNTKVNGILDGAIKFALHRSEDGITAQIGSWIGHSAMNEGGVKTMRAAAYELLARYREHNRQALNRMLEAA